MKDSAHPRSRILKVFLSTIVISIIIFPFLPFYLVIRTIVTIWQPYFHQRDMKSWDKVYTEMCKKGIFIDFPPRYGTLMGIPPWNVEKYGEDYDEPLD